MNAPKLKRALAAVGLLGVARRIASRFARPQEHGHQLVIGALEARRPTAPTVVEVGTTRELLPGQDSTTKIARAVNALGGRFITVDMDPENTSSAVPRLRAIDESFVAVTAKGEEFLHGYDGRLDAVYLDAFDIPHGAHSAERIEKYRRHLNAEIDADACHAMHLACAEAIVERLAPDGFVVIDDTWWSPEDGWSGKGATAGPYFEDNGFRLDEASHNAVRFTRDRAR